ncbi:oxaloacetate decarboxylase subunit alpha [Thermoanaerobacterium thermosaccharolyticum]|uniref:oxaloacetate decarboxylase subunit alpha n=1 Tax=Thermoanaerobacterium thermosaccharolyticum TaxID=1517 RepID=UPI001042F9F8|nr:oxaloacetate decarboxylase subunit alpha [Thermoanaerobacterium thermosaccharolyticum]KAA5807676.1 oxaloacetate decarboxylase subunit alpha [Thermoanaerobacterium thermosaccharolyticum]TCW37212.1 oxaloacetate decarboxylase alpha subunit [Thermohydrogenium kirishiense]
MSKIKITETVLRDAHQSLLATRMTTDEMLPIAEKLDEVGYFSLEAWGGATFDACMRFLDEDPWERLRLLKKAIKKTPLQMLLRGQNLLGYKHYPDDVVNEFIIKSVENGIDIIRIFDALNDVRNLEVPIKAAKSAGAHVQAAIVYTISPVHNTEHYLKVAKSLQDMGADSICIKDMSGILSPYVAYDLIKSFKKAIRVPVHLHSHYTAGLASMTYLKAIEAGVDVVDTAISPLALGTSQPATEAIVAALKDTKYDTGLNLKLLSEIADYFKKVKEHHTNGSDLSLLMSVDATALESQIPGGMLSNLVLQLKQQNALDKYNEVLKEVPHVRRDLGYPPLVTPMSQMVGTQAVLNVVTGERYKIVPKEIKDYVKGLYGRPPIPISDEIRKKIIGDEEIITKRPADLLSPQLDKIRNEIKEYLEQEEDVLSYALFPQVAKNFFEYRRAKKYKIDSTLVNMEEKTYPI